MQIRDGLHIFTRSPEGRLRTDLLIALSRTPRGYDMPGQASLLRAMADDLGLGFDPLDCMMGDPWRGPKPASAGGYRRRNPGGRWATRSSGSELLAIAPMVEVPQRPARRHADRVADRSRRPQPSRVDAMRPAPNERRFSRGARRADSSSQALPARRRRGRPDVLPTGRNFYSVDTRSVPTATAWGISASVLRSCWSTIICSVRAIIPRRWR